MQFTTWSFALFLILAVAVYYSVPRRGQWIVLLVGSYVFYAFAGLSFLPFLLASTLVTYLCSFFLDRARKNEESVLADHPEWEKPERKAFRAGEKKKRFHILILGLVAGLGILCVLKYTGFVASLFGARSLPDLILPMGISFYTFQSVGYLIDLYRGKAEFEKNPFRLALFVSFFPQLVQGPISRFSELEPQFFGGHAFDGSTFRSGILRMAWGYFKKVVIADTAMIGVKALVEDPGRFSGVYVVLLILLYSVEIYGDFTGGIDITIGVASLFGITLAENFDRPFSSRSVKEYWRRWHITMGTWFSDYVFYPLSVCRPMQKLSKASRDKLGNAVGKRIPVYLATIVTWFLTGLWHGAGLNFIVWGLLNCAVILISQELQPLRDRFNKKFPRFVSSRGFGVFCCVRTFLLMGWIRSLDCFRDVPLTFSLCGS